MNYVYGGTDPEQVTSLTKASNPGMGQPYATYTYDAAGNQTSRCYGATVLPVCAGEAMEYVYDGKDQLRRATQKVNGAIQGSEEYWYDGNGQRMTVVKRDGSGAKTGMTWFIGDVEAHYDAAGTVTKVYSHLSLGTPVARLERTGNTTTSLELQFHGLASNTIAAVDQGGTINASFSYAPFGEVLEATNAGGAGAGTAVHKRRFNDKYEDDVGGLTYYGARYYDKTLIGWTQSDPMFRFEPDRDPSDPRRANLYTFSLQNSLRYVDPDGRNSEDLTGCDDKDNCPVALVERATSGIEKPEDKTAYTNEQAIEFLYFDLGFSPNGPGQTVTGLLKLGYSDSKKAEKVWESAKLVSETEFNNDKTSGINDKEDAFRHAYASYLRLSTRFSG